MVLLFSTAQRTDLYVKISSASSCLRALVRRARTTQKSRFDLYIRPQSAAIEVEAVELSRVFCIVQTNNSFLGKLRMLYACLATECMLKFLILTE